MKAILINSDLHEINEIDIKGDLQSIYDAIKVDLITIVDIGNNSLFVDDEGLLKPNYLFQVQGRPHPLAGHGLILGLDYDTGESVDTTLSVEAVEKLISFLTPKGQKVQAIYA